MSLRARRAKQSRDYGSNQYYVYILSNNAGNVLYTGVTNDLIRRVYEHRGKFVDGFTSRYNVIRLVYYEATDDVEGAITREKQIKAGPRRKKIELINALNPRWDDLYDGLA
ncbi:MAG TPA: GIY-YIG nuclease family protein [Dehalococcoidia bacterium]|nr:GIY-YIG nuclease family protein [Dehalococcoidia bacterium]